jgi:molecular chaperone HscB
MKDYFSLFDLAPAFILDTQHLRKQYLRLQRQFHPDLHTQSSNAEQADMLLQSSLLTQAYEVLTDSEKRMQYILNMYNAMPSEGQSKLPSSFLMEMMELNETIDEAAPSETQQILTEIETTEKALEDQVAPFLSRFDQAPNTGSQDPSILQPILDFYLKKKYISRLKSRLQAEA